MTGVERPHTSYVLDAILLDGAMLLKTSLRGSRRSRGFPFFHVHPLASLFFLALLLSRCVLFLSTFIPFFPAILPARKLANKTNEKVKKLLKRYPVIRK